MKYKLMCLVTAVCVCFAAVMPAFAVTTSSVVQYDKEAPTITVVDGTPTGIAVDGDGELLILDPFNKVVWKTGEDELTVYAGQIGPEDLNGEHMGGYIDADANTSRFGSLWGIAPFLGGWAVTDPVNKVVRVINERGVRTANGMELTNPSGLAADEAGNLYIADAAQGAVFKMTDKGEITRFAEGFKEPSGMCMSGGVLYVCDAAEHCIYSVRSGSKTKLCGGEEGYRDGRAGDACFSLPQGIAADSEGALYVADAGNGAVRRIKDGMVSTLLAVTDHTLWPASPCGIAMKGEDVIVSDNLTGAIVIVPKEKKAEFTDISKDAWYYDSVAAVVGFGLMNGMGDGSFQPTGTLSRAMQVQVLYNLRQFTNYNEILIGEADFDDVEPDRWYAPAVGWAQKSGITSGVDPDGRLFAPANDITRQEFAIMLYRFVSASPVEKNSLEAFPDAGDVSRWAIDAMNWAVTNGILGGYDDGTLRPKQPVTRAQTAAILLRMIDSGMI